MREVRIGLVGVAVAGVLMLAQSLAAGAAAPALSLKPITPARAQALGYQAYMYGFPLLEFLRVAATETSVRCPDANGDEPVNTFSQHSRLARPSDRTVIAPNVDTLYSIAHLDLRRGPVVLSHPSMGHRYFVFELLDPYTNVIGYIGSRTTGSKAGRFAIEWTGHRGPVARGVKVIHSNYRRVWVVGRTLVYGGAGDSRRAMALMRRYLLTPPGGARRFARGCKPGKPHKAVTPDGMAFMRRLDTALTNNPPPARDHRLLRKLARVGLGAHLRVAEAGLAPDVRRALIAGVDQAAASLPTLARSKVLQEALADHGWATIGNGIGAYGTDYLWRAEVAELGLGANTVQEAVYPTALTDSSGRPLSGVSDYRLVFKRGQAPPNRAFWSLTMYDSSGFLVPNPMHRYAIGSTHPPLRRQPDGSIVILISHTRPHGSHINWLPAPSSGFRLNLRIYRPRRAVLDGRWQPPPVQRLTP
jgi:hypothetical protein